MKKQTSTYRLLTVWLLAAVLINLVYPAGMKAAQLFCEKGSAQTHVTEKKSQPTCWMNMDSETKEIGLTNNCSLNQMCEQALNIDLNETPAIQQQNIQIPGLPLTGSTFNPTLKITNKISPEKSLADNLKVREIYLLNSTFLI